MPDISPTFAIFADVLVFEKDPADNAVEELVGSECSGDNPSAEGL